MPAPGAPPAQPVRPVTPVRGGPPSQPARPAPPSQPARPAAQPPAPRPTAPAAPVAPVAPAARPAASAANRPVAFAHAPASPASPGAAQVVPAAPTPPGQARASTGAWTQERYVVKERRMTFGRQYEVFDGQGRLVAYSKQKIFRLKEDIRFYSDSTKQVELFRLAARRILDFKANVDVIDSATGAPVASIRRKGWKSLLKDEWMFFAPDGTQFGTMHEIGGFRAFLRRWGDAISTFVPAHFDLYVGQKPNERLAGTVRERFQMWGDTYDLHRDPNAPFDARLLISAVVLADAMGVGGGGA